MVQAKETRIMLGTRTVCARNHSLFAAVDLLRPHLLFTSVSLVHQVLAPPHEGALVTLPPPHQALPGPDFPNSGWGGVTDTTMVGGG